MANKKGATLRVPPRGFVRLKCARADGKGGWSVTIPAPLARMIGREPLFRVELVEEGILLRYVEGTTEAGPVLPGWMIGGSDGDA